MPSAQVIDFGEDPNATSIGGFAKNFLTEVNDRATQRRNDELFRRIADKYGKDSNPEEMFTDILKSEGLDQEYKRNRLNEIKEYAELSNKKKLNLIEQAKLEQRQNELKAREETNRIADARLQNEIRKTNAQGTKSKASLPKQISDYTKNILKESGESLPTNDLLDLNNFVEELVSDEESPVSIPDAVKHAYQYIQARREKIDTHQITPRPTPWVGSANESDLNRDMDRAYQELKALYEEDGIDNQKDLRSIAERSGWKKEEINVMLQRVFRENGKKLRGSTPEQSAEIPASEQGVVSEIGGIDDILFGE